MRSASDRDVDLRKKPDEKATLNAGKKNSVQKEDEHTCPISSRGDPRVLPVGGSKNVAITTKDYVISGYDFDSETIIINCYEKRDFDSEIII